jgi:hypothetical protein
MFDTNATDGATDGSRIAKKLLRASAYLVTTLLFSSAASAYTVTVFGSDVWDADTVAMDALLGVSGALVEDFEDTTLIAGLTEAHGAGNLTLPSPGATAWDGSNLISIQNAPIVFTYTPGASTFGFGISGDQMVSGIDGPETFLINGNVDLTVDLADFTEYQLSSLRNGYVRIDVEGADLPITSITLVSPDSSDTVSFDHMAIVAVPEPNTSWLLASALLVLAGARRFAGPQQRPASAPGRRRSPCRSRGRAPPNKALPPTGSRRAPIEPW